MKQRTRTKQSPAAVKRERNLYRRKYSEAQRFVEKYTTENRSLRMRLSDNLEDKRIADAVRFLAYTFSRLAAHAQRAAEE